MCRHSRTPREIEEIKKNWEKQDKTSWKHGDKLVNKHNGKSLIFKWWYSSYRYFRDSECHLYDANDWELAPTNISDSCAKTLKKINEQWSRIQDLTLEINIQPMNKTYILLKDTHIGVKKGAEYVLDAAGNFYVYDGGAKYDVIHKSDVESNPEWFKLKEEKEFSASQLERAVSYAKGNPSLHWKSDFDYLVKLFRKENNS